MNWTLEKVSKALAGKLIGNIHVRKMVCKTILYLPSDSIEYVTQKVWFISSPEDAWAITFKGLELKDRHLIFLSHELFEQDDKQITYTILHEVGHVMLNHRNSIGYHQTKEEVRKQEKEADEFAKKYLHIS